MKFSALLLGSALLGSAFVSSASALTHTFTYTGNHGGSSGAIPSEGSYFFANSNNPQSFVLSFNEGDFNASADSNPAADAAFYKFNGSLTYQITPVAGNTYTGASLQVTPFTYTFSGLLQLSYFFSPGITNASLTIADEAMTIPSDPYFGGSPTRASLGLGWWGISQSAKDLSLLFQDPSLTDVRISHATTGNWLALVGSGNAKFSSHTTSGGPTTSVPDTASTLALGLCAIAGLLVVSNRKRSALGAA